MIPIQQVVEKILIEDEEALSAFTQGYMNFSGYAARIKKEVERRTKKEVRFGSIVVALSRMQHTMRKAHPLVSTVVIDNISTHAPLTELAFDKTPDLLAEISNLYARINTEQGDFLTMTMSSNHITIICSDRLTERIKTLMDAEPVLAESGLAAIGLAVPEKYYREPNITYSLLRKIATRRIVLAETVTSHREIIFIFAADRLPDVLALYSLSSRSGDMHR